MNLQIPTKLALSAMVRDINPSFSRWMSLQSWPVIARWRSALMNQDACCLLVEVDFLLLTVQTLSLSGFHAVVQTSWITYVWHFPPIPMPALTLSLFICWLLQWWGNPCDHICNVVGIQCVHPVCLGDSQLCRQEKVVSTCSSLITILSCFLFVCLFCFCLFLEGCTHSIWGIPG